MKKKLKALSLTLLALGALASAYLMMRSLALLGGETTIGVDVCRAVIGTTCDETLLSPASMQFGIPLAGWGLAFYVSITVLLGLGWAQGEAFESEATVGALTLSTFAAIASIVLLVIMILGYAPFCLICAVVHAINFALVFVLKALTGKSIVEVLLVLKSAGTYLLGGKIDDPIQTGWKLNGFITAALVGIAVYLFALNQTNRQKAAAEQIITQYELAKVVEIPVDDRDLRQGSADSKLQMVVFSSFQCPGCRTFAPIMNRIADEFDGELSVVFKHFPLSTECNPVMKINLHPLGCQAAQTAESAGRQGKFWAYHDQIFAEPLIGADGVSRVAKSSGVDVDKLNRDTDSDAVAEKVKADIELGNRLEIVATPTVFLNGRRIRSLSFEALSAVIRYEMKTDHTAHTHSH